MVVVCPKCKVKLRVADEKIGREGTRFKCPKCSTVLLVKKTVSSARPLDEHKVLVAHEDASVADKIKTLLASQGYEIITVRDGIEAMVSAARELPFLSILSVSLPKIYGFEVAGRLKKRPETKDMKAILVTSLHDETKYRREPDSLHGTHGYIEEHQIETSLLGKIESFRNAPQRKIEPATKREEKTHEETAPPPGQRAVETKQGTEVPREGVVSQKPILQTNDLTEKAKRLARTIVSDIYLYSRAKVDEAIRKGTFHELFASEVKEGIKLYESRIPAEVRRQGDFFNEAVTNFIEKKKKELAQ